MFYYARFVSVLLKLLRETRVKICHENTNPCIIFSALESYLAEMKIFYLKWGLHQSKTATITSDYEVLRLRISQAHLQTIQMHREKTNNTFIFFQVEKIQWFSLSYYFEEGTFD